MPACLSRRVLRPVPLGCFAALTLALLAGSPGCAGGSSDPSPTGTGNTGGGAGTGGTTTCGPQSPPPASGGANYPFPQHRLSQHCGYPANCKDADVQMAWATYKTKMVVSVSSGGCSGLRVQRPENGNDTVSEGLAYGMLFAVYMNDKATFDGIWSFAKCRRNGRGLLSWLLNSTGGVVDPNAATDADEDAAFALVMADRQWGGGSYMADATALINAILNNEVASNNTLEPDDVSQNDVVNPSYFAPAYYKVFAQVTGQSRWTQVVDRTYQVLELCAHDTTGLVPDWCSSSSGAPNGRGMNYAYDAARTPFRIAQDACWNNDQRAIGYLERLATFFDGVGPANIRDGYAVNGTVTGMYPAIPTFVGPAGTSGMPGNHAALMQDTYARTAAIIRGGTSSAYNYFNGSVGLLSILLMTGNFVNFAGL